MNYYEILNVSPDAPLNEITIAHKKLAMKLHPDRNKGDSVSEEKFKQVNKAYTILSNITEREKYDQQLKEEKEKNEAAKRASQQNNDIHNQSQSNFNRANNNFNQRDGNNDNFQRTSSFNEPNKTSIQTIKVNLDFWDAIKGGRQELEFYYNNNYYTTIVDLPEGVESGFKVTVQTNTSEVILIINVSDDLYYDRSGLDLYAKASIPMHIALLGGFITFPHFRGSIDVKIPPETQNGDTVVVDGFGVKRNNTTGHLILTVNVELPKKLTSKQRELIKEFSVLESEKENGLFSMKTAQIWKKLMAKFKA